MKKTLLIVNISMILICSEKINAHCQIPCGIYDDEARFVALFEDLATIRKSVTAINEERKSETKDYNQLIRWIINKEEHADHIKEVVLEYFLAQRIKEGQPDYEKKLVALHKIIVLAMNAKQQSDPKIVDNLQEAITVFQNLYNK